MKDDWLERRLRDAEPHIADDGFTRRVLAGLPAPRRHARGDTILAAGALVGAAGVALLFPVLPVLNLVLRAIEITWLAVGLALAGALVALPDTLRRWL